MNMLTETTVPLALPVRSAEPSDIPRIMELIESAKGIMRSDGNPTQWGGTYPERHIIERDIENGHGWIVEHEGTAAGYFAFIPSPEPTYARIEGRWLEDISPYFVIHRIASTPDSHGIFRSIIAHASKHCSNLRIDTHHDNRIMQKLILSSGFTYCGIIHLANGDPRLAYQKL